jgi:hypothetical protein
MIRARSHLSMSIAAGLALLGCEKGTGEARTIGPAEPAERAATSFIHCVELEGGGCVHRDPKQGSWDAFALLQWLGVGSPTSILEALRRELERHRDPLAVQDRFVVVASRYRQPLRGAECRPDSATPLAELLPKLNSHVETRMQGLGLWRDDLADVVGGLADEAKQGLDEGWLVHMTCYDDPFELWVATAKQDDRQVVVGMLTSLPSWLGGSPLDDEGVENRLAGKTLGGSTTLGVVREGTVDTRWVPVPIEEF